MKSNGLKNGKRVAWDISLVALWMVILCLSASLIHGCLTKEHNRNDRLRASLAEALEASMKERGREALCIVSCSYTVNNLEDSVPKVVTVDIGDGPREYVISACKHTNNVAKNPTERIYDSCMLEEQPLKADSLGMQWERLLAMKGISAATNLRVSVTDLSGDVSVAYANDSYRRSAPDSLFSYYIGYRCEVEVTAFVSPFSYWHSLLWTDWVKFFCLLVSVVFVWKIRPVRNKRLVLVHRSEGIGEVPAVSEGAVLVLPETLSCIYRLGDDVCFDATDQVLRRGKQIESLLPQSSALLLGLLKSEEYCLSISDICLLLWPDGSGRPERVHTVASRLRSSLSKVSPCISIVGRNSKYQLKIAHSIEENTV